MMDREELKLMLSRMGELEKRASSAVALGDFLTPEEQTAVAAAYPRCYFWGGYRGAQRRAVMFLPNWMEELFTFSDGEADAVPLSPFGIAADKKEAAVARIISDGTDGGAAEEHIIALSLRCSDFVTLTHRDWMGTVLSLGLERRCIGDICVTSEHSALVFAHRRIGGYIAENLHRAGRDAVHVGEVPMSQVSVPPIEFENISVTVASPRLDGVVKALCGVSRESAAELIRQGEVQVNHTVEERCDAAVSPSDVVCVRGAGKYIVDSFEGENRRGRLRLAVRKYV